MDLAITFLTAPLEYIVKHAVLCFFKNLRSENASNLCQALYASLGPFLWLQHFIVCLSNTGVLKPKEST